MAETSSIEWTDATWNPITGCSVVSPGCTNCYAMKLAGTRLRSLPSRMGLTVETKAGPVWNGRVRMNEEWLTQPLRWRRPRKIFVCAHGDLFAENVPDEWIDRVFAVMALAPQHTFQVLTKRAARMRAYFEGCTEPPPDLPLHKQWVTQWHRRAGVAQAMYDLGEQGFRDRLGKARDLPLPNVWLGVSAEDQRRADERVPDLLATPAAVRFVSAEPLLGPIDFTNLGRESNRFEDERQDALRGWVYDEDPQDGSAHGITPGYGRLDWIIVGGESGPGARPMHPEWARVIRDECASAGIAFHYKQAGAWAALKADGGEWPTDTSNMIRLRWDGSRGPEGVPMQRVGKKAAGRLLDGVEHNGFPEPA